MHCSPLKSSGILAREETSYIRFSTNISVLYKIFIGAAPPPIWPRCCVVDTVVFGDKVVVIVNDLKRFVIGDIF